MPQIIIGLAVTREGIPVRCWCWPGNAGDQALLPEVRVAGYAAGASVGVFTVVNRGFSSTQNLAYLQRGGGNYIAGERMRDGSARAREVLARQGRYRPVGDNLRVKEVQLAETPGTRWIVCYNPEEAARDAAQREAALPRVASELDRIAAARARAADQARSRKNPTTTSTAAASAPNARPSPNKPRTSRPSARCASTPRWAATCARARADDSRSTGARSSPKRGWTASTCSRPPTRICRPRTSRWATRTSSGPSAGFGT